MLMESSFHPLDKCKRMLAENCKPIACKTIHGFAEKIDFIDLAETEGMLTATLMNGHKFDFPMWWTNTYRTRVGDYLVYNTASDHVFTLDKECYENSWLELRKHGLPNKGLTGVESIAKTLNEHATPFTKLSHGFIAKIEQLIPVVDKEGMVDVILECGAMFRASESWLSTIGYRNVGDWIVHDSTDGRATNFVIMNYDELVQAGIVPKE